MGGGHCVFSNYSNYLAALQKLWVFFRIFYKFFLGKISLTSFLVYRKAEREEDRLRVATNRPLPNLKRDSFY